MAEETIKKNAVVVGGGLVGSLLAIRLANEGHTVDVYERRADLRKASKQEGRSINLAISVRGLHALKQVGLHEEALKIAIPMHGRMVHPLTGATNLQSYSPDRSECIYSISRSGLNGLLLDAAERSGRVRIHFGEKVDGVDLDRRTFTIQGETKSYDLLFGTDGSSSVIRDAISEKAGEKEDSSILAHGYKEILMPARSDGSHALEKEALHIWPRETFMLIALPNLDGSFTCTLFLPFMGSPSFVALGGDEKVQEFFGTQFPDLLPLLPNLLSEYNDHPVGQMITVKTPCWSYSDSVCLLGDAAHAIVPFFGQGMNCGFEDVTVLMELHRQMHWSGTFEAFENARKSNTNAIADMAVENFIEMRDKVADEEFLREKALEREVQKRFQGQYANRYQLVTFTRLPYQIAYELGEIEAEILRECQNVEEAASRVEKEVLPRIASLNVNKLRGI